MLLRLITVYVGTISRLLFVEINEAAGLSSPPAAVVKVPGKPVAYNYELL